MLCSSKIGGAFGPVMLVWFITIAVMGIAQIIRMPNILLSFSPYYAASFFARNGTTGFVALGAVVLSVTGGARALVSITILCWSGHCVHAHAYSCRASGETLYADMGHFGIGPIRLGWLGFVLPCLLCNYFGQGVTIIQNPETAANPFYLMVRWRIGCARVCVLGRRCPRACAHLHAVECVSGRLVQLLIVLEAPS